MVPYFATWLDVEIVKKLYQKSFSFPSFIPLLLEYLKSRVIPSTIGSAVVGDLHSTTTKGRPFTNSTISGIMCFSVPGMFTLNCEMAMKELFLGLLKSMNLTVGLFSPVLRFSDTEVFSTRRSCISLLASRRKFAVGVVILLTTSFIWSSSIQGFIFSMDFLKTSSRIISLKLSRKCEHSSYRGSKDGSKDLISLRSCGSPLFCL